MSNASISRSLQKRDLTVLNREFYEGLWSGSQLERPDRFNTWPMVSELIRDAGERLEVGPGLRPRLPVRGTHVVDLSRVAVEKLKELDANARVGEITALPFADESFGLVAAFDVIEHVEEDRRAFAELSRVLRDDGLLVCSVPLHAENWTSFDAYVGHARRYEPAALVALLEENDFAIERSAIFGMQPNNPRLLDFGVRMMKRHRRTAMWWYNRVFMPLGMFFQKKLRFEPGLLDTRQVHEVVLVCRRKRRTAALPISS